MSKVEVVMVDNAELKDKGSYFYTKAVVGRVYKVFAGTEFFVTKLQDKAIRLPIYHYKYVSEPAHELVSITANITQKLVAETKDNNISRILIFLPRDLTASDTVYFCAALEMFNE